MLKRHGLSKWFILTSFAALCVGARAQTNIIITPKEAEGAFGNSGGNLGNQMVYAAPEFEQVPNGSMVITEVAFRADEQEDGFSALIDHLVLQANVFPGTMEEIAERKNALFPPVTTVFDRTNVLLAARAKFIDAFGLRIKLDRPFEYEPRRGQLVLRLSGYSRSGTLGFVDQQYVVDGSGHASFSRGAIISEGDILTGPSISPHIVVTRFTYVPFLATIQAIRSNAFRVEIDFQVLGQPASIHLESSEKVDGQYSVDDSGELNALGENEFRTTAPFRSINRFFRIALR